MRVGKSQLPAWAQGWLAPGSMPAGLAGAAEQLPQAPELSMQGSYQPAEFMLQPHTGRKPLLALCRLEGERLCSLQAIATAWKKTGKGRTETRVLALPATWLVETWGLSRVGNTRWPIPRAGASHYWGSSSRTDTSIVSPGCSMLLSKPGNALAPVLERTTCDSQTSPLKLSVSCW